MKDLFEKDPGISRREFIKGGACLAANLIYLPLIHLSSSLPRNRVVWVHDGHATSWDGITGYYGDYVNQARVSAMIEQGIKELTGESDANSAWQRIIPNYSPGKKIAIKININNSGWGYGIDALAEPIMGIISGLKTFGVVEGDIYVMEPSRLIPVHIGDPIISLYPNILLWDVDWGGSYGHKVSYNSTNPSLKIQHSHPSLSDSKLPDQFLEISYFINMPIIKGHWGSAGVTLTFKNNFGLVREIDKFHPYTYYSSPDYSYDKNPLHDLYLNTHIKDKTVLIVGDALFGHSDNNAGIPPVWGLFGGKFPNSIFLSRDPVAVDSVMFDFLNAEVSKPNGSQLYLHRAFELGLGTHEHWNNSNEKNYAIIDFRKIDMNV